MEHEISLSLNSLRIFKLFFCEQFVKDFFLINRKNSLDEYLDFEAQTLIIYSTSASGAVFDIAGS